MPYENRPPRSQSQSYTPPESPAEIYLKGHTADILNFRKTAEIDKLLTNLKEYARDKGRDITTSQVRNIFSKIKKPRLTRQELQMIRPKLAYIAARQKKAGAEQIVNFFETLIKEVGDDQVKDFVAFFEAFVAYHKVTENDKKSA